jgi:hypothetical protein
MSAVRAPARGDVARRLATETKASFKTTEFIAFLSMVAGVLTATAVVDQADARGLARRGVSL